MGLLELKGQFTPEACSEITCVADYGVKVYTKYTKLIAVSEIVEPTDNLVIVKLGIPAGV